jgi:UPF0271 protein
MKAVLDSSFFFYDLPIEGELFTTGSVVSELKDLRSKGKLEQLLAAGLIVTDPLPGSVREVAAAAIKTGDSPVLSVTDHDLLALAKERDAILYTDDFAVQNIASALGIRTQPMQQRRARQIQWKYRCSGCGRYADKPGECLVCGAEVKRKLK